MSKKLTSIFLKIFTFFVFVAVCGVTLFLAYGYQFDMNKRDVIRYSIIDLVASMQNAEISLDGTPIAISLPSQIKNVEPGSHHLIVKKSGFLPWERMVEVEPDFVSIVNDIFLIPEKIEPFNVFITSFDDEEKLFYAKDAFVSLLPGSKNFRLVSLYDNGTYKNEEIELFSENIESIQYLEREKILIAFPDDKYAWIDFSSQKIDYFSLPVEATKIKVNESNRNVYFLVGSSLYRVPFGYTKVHDDDLLSFKVGNDIQAYDFDLNGNFYFLASGMLFKANERGGDIELLKQEPGKYVNLAFKKGKNYGTLILRNKDEGRALYLVDRFGNMTQLALSIKGQPSFNAFDQLIFSNGQDEMYFYDPRTLEKEFLGTLPPTFELAGWFSDVGHYVLKNSESLVMSDVFTKGKYTLLMHRPTDQLFILNKSLFYLKDKKLWKLYWSN